MRLRQPAPRRHRRHDLLAASATRGLASLLLLAACGDDGAPQGDDETSGGPSLTDGPDPSAADSTEAGTEAGTEPGTTPVPIPGNCDFSESFDVADGSPWPAPWQLAGNVATADVQGGRGRLVPNTNAYSLARMYVPLGCTNAEGTLSFEFTDGATQGVGLYLRQSGGYLDQTNPPGSGYAAFVESFRDPAGIGVWREVDGHEELIGAVTPMSVEAGVVYRVRFRVTQASPTESLLQARMWRDGEAEPAQWQAEATDSFPALQGALGGLGIDAYSSLTQGQASVLYVDDIEITAAI